MSVCVRYIEPQNNIFILREDFLTFVPVENTKGAYLAERILSTLKNVGIDCEYLIGQGYDGAAAMKGCFNGVQAVIRKSHPEALYVHCCSHSLNLALCHSCQIQSARNTIGIIKSVGNFLKSSAKRTSYLKENIRQKFPETKYKNLTAMCDTRWVDNHDGLIRFEEIFEAIVDALEELSCDMDSDTSSSATSFLRSITASDFVVSLCCMAMLFYYTLALCKLLQSPTCDLAAALQHIGIITKTFEKIQANVDLKFAVIFKTAQDLLHTVNEEVRIPRIANRQQYRANQNTNDPESYFRLIVVIPLLDDFINHLHLKFADHKSTLLSLYILIPSLCCKNDSNFQINAFKVYRKFLEWESLEVELHLWKMKWQQESEINHPTCAIEALGECNENLFLSIHKLLKILATLPVTTCTPERTFSTLKRLKIYLRNSTGQERLTGLALMSMHRKIDINTEAEIDLCAAKKARRLNILL
ncbi:52 kDa repressor of the inhibitor of the protein kinase-like [Belonocnema kinseyi]|uniref:52 kDa repressor of the inhibitor of the protein kinase-like n=1 Tax=Belonocnema kinseyi TaxID=2817044 RepID=UPI00143CCAE8|nr:52 kDa repressor of the inhibitor of the protein kinase-like [Belonocnema kinseyi]